jgi:histidinol phosphatase-like enzyme (inositol monophosphatase family)
MTILDLESFFEELAKRAGDVTLPFFRSQMMVTDKAHGAPFDPVTEADRAAEIVIRKGIEAQFPTHGILGEEFGSLRGDADYIWVIDPIDGTRSFVCGLPLWGTLIGLMKHGQPVYGLMYQPYTRELFTGDGKKAQLKTPSLTRRLSTRPCESLDSAYLMTTTPQLFQGDEARKYRSIEDRVRLARYGADCYAYMMLASGQIDLVIETGLKPYDILPLVPIIEGAGGIVTDWRGEPMTGGGNVVVAGDIRLHTAALEILNAN